MRQITILFLILIGGISSLSANWKMDSCVIKNYSENGIGDFALHAISAKVIGTAYVSNNKFPDIFVSWDKWYPGMNRYRYVEHTQDGVPVFERKESVAFPSPLKIDGVYASAILQNGKGDIRLFWHANDSIRYAFYDKKSGCFGPSVAVPFPKVKYVPKTITVKHSKSGGYVIYYGAQDRFGKSVPGDKRSAEYFPYDGAGIWRGEFTYCGLYKVEFDKDFNVVTKPEMVSTHSDDILQSYCKVDNIELSKERGEGVVAGSYLGGLYYYEQDASGKGFAKKKYLVDERGNAHRHPGIWATPIAYPNVKGQYCDVIATCEGGIYYYGFTNKFTSSDKPIYNPPTPLQEVNTILYGGSLPVPTSVDWDKDGVLDIVSGNSQGNIQFFRNVGTNKVPRFISPILLKAAGRTIHIQPGYGEDIQGPLEARWGYVGPNVFDWNGDGKYDILTNDSRGKHSVFIGKDGVAQDCLDVEHALFLKDLDLRGTWRCRPGISVVGSDIVYVTLDDQNELHMYTRIDDYNLDDNGKLQLEDGSFISASARNAGGTGRLKIEIADWDGDGVKDILLGANKHHSIPNSEKGIPNINHKRRFDKVPEKGAAYTYESLLANYLIPPVYWESSPIRTTGATVLFMKNIGSDLQPKYKFPVQMRYKNERIKLGQHVCGVAATFMGDVTDSLPNLLVSDERGRFFILQRNDIQWE